MTTRFRIDVIRGGIERYAWYQALIAGDGVRQILLDSRRCTSTESLFAEIDRAISLPAYFGHNWDALNECLSDYLVLNDGGLGSEFGDREGISAGTLLMHFTECDSMLSVGDDLLSNLARSLEFAGTSNDSGRFADLRVVFEMSEHTAGHAYQSFCSAVTRSAGPTWVRCDSS